MSIAALRKQVNTYRMYLFAGIVLFAGFLFLINLGGGAFWDYDEGTYANVMRDTLQTGQVLTLHLGDGTWFEKPPLYFWLSMAANTVFVHPEFSYRLISALLGVASIILIMLVAYEIRRDVLAAYLAGLILLLTGAFFEAGRQVRLDIPAISMILLAIYCFLRGLRSPSWFIGMGVAMALGVLFKSVIGLLSIPFIFWWSLLYWRFDWIKGRYAFFAGLAFFVVVAPWHIYESLLYGWSFWEAYFGHHVVDRFDSNILAGQVSSISMVNFFLTYAAPWTALFVFVCIWLATQYRRRTEENLRSIFVCALTALSLLALFLMSSTKIYYYLLPVYPFVALTLALSAHELLTRFSLRPYIVPTLVVLLSVFSAFAMWVTINYGFHRFAIISVNDVIVKEERDVGNIIKQMPKDIKLYSFQYDYYDTIQYYSGRTGIDGVMSDDQVLDTSFLLFVGKEYMDWHAFSPELMAHLETLYKGQSLILYKFNP